VFSELLGDVDRRNSKLATKVTSARVPLLEAQILRQMIVQIFALNYDSHYLSARIAYPRPGARGGRAAEHTAIGSRAIEAKCVEPKVA